MMFHRCVSYSNSAFKLAYMIASNLDTKGFVSRKPCSSSMVFQLIIVLKHLRRKVTLNSAGRLFSFKYSWLVLTLALQGTKSPNHSTLTKHFIHNSVASCLEVMQDIWHHQHCCFFWYMKYHSSSSLITMVIVLNPVCLETIFFPLAKGPLRIHRLKFIKGI